MKYIILACTLGWMATCSLFATTYEDGIAAYSSADYPKAIELFGKALEEKGPTAEAFYNLAAAYYKNGDIAPALLNFHRAYRLDPSDPDTRYNIKLLTSQTVDKMEPSPTFFFNRLLSTMSHWFNLTTWRILSLLFFVSALVGLFLFLRGRTTSARRWGFYESLVALILTIITHTLAYTSYQFTHDTNDALLMAGVVTVKSSPDASAKDIVVVHAGLKVEIIQHLAGFSEVQLPDGTIGWVPQDSYEIVNNFSNK